jgi:drug/metabolite transporter (DMT)-like permease
MTRGLAVAAGLVTLYVLWGSTYLAVRLAIETVPPLTMMGVRSVVAGALLCLVARALGARRPSLAACRGALAIGVLFFVGCHGVLAWVQQSVPSGFAALMLATIPLWVPLLTWLRGDPPAGRIVVALAVGFVGVALLIATSRGLAAEGLAPLSVVLLMLSALSWALGSVLSRAVTLPPSVPLASGLELLFGGAILLVLAVACGELAGFDPAAVSLRSALGLGWLILFGSVFGFTVYGWLLRVVPPERAATCAYVNPVIAVALGWGLLDEPVSAPMLGASALILASVFAALADPPRLTQAWRAGARRVGLPS